MLSYLAAVYHQLCLLGRRGLGWIPYQCVLCGDGITDAYLCEGCLRDLPWLAPARCPVCALPTFEGRICGQCLRAPPAFDATYSSLSFDFPLDALVRAYKFQHRLALQPLLSDLLTRARPVERPDLLIPVPLATERLRERGFNQAYELIRPWAAQGWPLSTQHLIKIRDTAPQHHQSQADRARNLKGAFECINPVRGLHILLVDDVMTSGATLHEAALTLKRWGALRVSCLILARTLPQRR
ncbi:ComF family protein [Chitinivorax tropicus]|uniref:ComF family protein n=1 Tax=Chitinivorax tropicus TaxID=714531 RepID=A0A840MMK7_9PROT|nr:ComF family protein [Chitinivorax tropicus]MBB5018177.1 ComF family protein [Chitinivorax tropicus]